MADGSVETQGRLPPADRQPPLAYLWTFHAVATLGGFTRAAQALHLSQPAVSGHIRVLERHYEARLFVVHHRRARLTPEGQALFAHTERIFNLVRRAGRAVAATRDLEAGQLALGASTTVGVYLLPALLGRFTRAHPKVQIVLAVGTSAEVRARVLADEVPLGLVEAPLAQLDHPDLEVVPFATDELVLIAPPHHPWARADAVEPGQLQAERLLRREAGAGTRVVVDSALAAAGVTMETAMELGSTEALKQAVMAGLGLAWVSRLTVARELAGGAVAVVRTPGRSEEHTS
jgi:DNA-binding transcriptional LysR family regulator